jgi:hypothetical protein
MTFIEFLTILALFGGPISAVQIQKFIERRTEGHRRKLDVFKTLMASRANRVSAAHVEALNRIDTEFYKDKNVIESWKQYHAQLYGVPRDLQDPDYKAKMAAWEAQSVEKLLEMLDIMAKSLGYELGKAYIQTSSYTPQLHADMQLEANFIRRSVVEIFLGTKSLPIEIKNSGAGK